MKTQNIGKLKSVKNTDFLRAIRTSHGHPRSMAKDQQHRGEPQPVRLTSCVTLRGGFSPARSRVRIDQERELGEGKREYAASRRRLAQKGCPDGLASWKHNFCFLYGSDIVNTGLFQTGFLLHCCSLLVVYLFSLLQSRVPSGE